MSKPIASSSRKQTRQTQLGRQLASQPASSGVIGSSWAPEAPAIAARLPTVDPTEPEAMPRNDARRYADGLAVAGTAWGTLRPVAPAAQAARSLTPNDEGRLHLVSESGSNLVEEGSATGTLPGRARVHIGAVIEAAFTLYPRGGGSISGHGSGTLHSSGLYASFGGSMSVSRGTGRYSHAHGTGGFYGTVNRKTFALVVQTRGILHY